MQNDCSPVFKRKAASNILKTLASDGFLNPLGYGIRTRACILSEKLAGIVLWAGSLAFGNAYRHPSGYGSSCWSVCVRHRAVATPCPPWGTDPIRR